MSLFDRGSKKASTAKVIALVGIMAATIECAKLALMFLPNIEVVTMLSALYGYAFGVYGVLATVVFVCIEPLIYGFGTWVVSYFLYWPLVAIVFMLFARLKIKNRFLFTFAGLVLTAWFGVLSSLVDIGLLSGFFDNFRQRFAVYYVRGFPFYIAQLACNAVLFLFLFKFLLAKLERVKSIFIK